MNLAFPLLCILLLSLPGILFRKAFARAAVSIRSFKGRGRHAVNKYPVSIRPVSEEISLSLIWAIVLHVFWLSCWSFFEWFDAPLDYRHIIRIIHGTSSIGTSGQASSNEYSAALDYLADNRRTVAAYFLTLYAFSFAIGRGSLELVRCLRLDHRYMVLRLEDRWFYFLRGEIFKFHEFKESLSPEAAAVEICGTYVSVVIGQSGKDFLYKGFLWDFELDRDGNLDRLVLHHTIRARFEPEYTDDEKAAGSLLAAVDGAPVVGSGDSTEGVRIEDADWTFQRVSSQLFTVRYADCKTLSCSYFYIRRKRPLPV